MTRARREDERGSSSRWVGMAARVARTQASNLAGRISGRPLATTPLGSMTLDEDDVQLARAWLADRTRWGDRRIVSDYESQFARWNGSKHALAFMSGRVALSACIHALGLGLGDEVIVPGYTCVAVANAFRFAGVRPVFSDIELSTYGLDAEEAEKKITPNTRAVLLHHLYGLVCRDYEAILELGARRDLSVIEDCAQATGAEYRGTKVGNLGDLAIYSSEQSKVFNTIQGGMATTNDDALAGGIRDYCEGSPYPDRDWIEKQLHNVVLNYLQTKHPDRWWRGHWEELRRGGMRLVSTTREEEQGIRPAYYRRRMPPPVAAIGANQLTKIDGYNERRRATSKRWDVWCEENGVRKPTILDGSVPVFLRYPVMVEPERKADTSWAASSLGVDVGVWFASNLHPSTIQIQGCPNADAAVRQCVNFPSLVDAV